MSKIFKQLGSRHPFSLVVVGVLLSIVVVLGLRGFWISSASAAQWQSATRVVPEALVAQAIASNSSLTSKDPPLDISNVKVMVLGQQAPLYVFDFNTPKLCGPAGCLYVVYAQQGESYQSVLNLYLNRDLPKGIPLIALKDVAQGSKPCLAISQRVPNSNQLSSLLYCEQGNRYQRVNESFSSL